VLGDGREVIEVHVRESRRARNARIVVNPGGGVAIVVPRRVSYAEIDRMLGEAREWIAKKRERVNSTSSTVSQLGLDRSGVVWLGLESIPIQVAAPAGAGPPRVRTEDGCLVVGSSSPEATRAAIDRWYRREARRRITAAVTREAGRLGVEHTSIAIRDQRTRWGSCSRRGTLSFNWRLVIAPGDVLDYVVIHELCHLRELNHSKAFWHLVDEAMPGWREQRDWLHEHGPELQAYRTPAQEGFVDNIGAHMVDSLTQDRAIEQRCCTRSRARVVDNEVGVTWEGDP
jgi:predicted metal-dependent hydrolase